MGHCDGSIVEGNPSKCSPEQLFERLPERSCEVTDTTLELLDVIKFPKIRFVAAQLSIGF